MLARQTSAIIGGVLGASAAFAAIFYLALRYPKKWAIRRQKREDAPLDHRLLAPPRLPSFRPESTGNSSMVEVPQRVPPIRSAPPPTYAGASPTLAPLPKPRPLPSMVFPAYGGSGGRASRSSSSYSVASGHYTHLPPGLPVPPHAHLKDGKGKDRISLTRRATFWGLGGILGVGDGGNIGSSSRGRPPSLTSSVRSSSLSGSTTPPPPTETKKQLRRQTFSGILPSAQSSPESSATESQLGIALHPEFAKQG